MKQKPRRSWLLDKLTLAGLRALRRACWRRASFLVWLGVVGLWSPESRAEVLPGVHAFDVVGGGSRPYVAALRLQAGYPWQAFQAQFGLPNGWTPLIEYDTALFQRHQPSLGLALRWVDRPRFRLTGEILVGWQIQQGELSQQGPSLALRLRALIRWSRIALFLRLDTRHTLLFQQTLVDRPTGIDTRIAVEHRWSPWASVGMAIHLAHHISLDIEAIWPWIDAPNVALPGIQIGLQIGLPTGAAR